MLTVVSSRGRYPTSSSTTARCGCRGCNVLWDAAYDAYVAIQHTATLFTTHVSYLEIYNEAGYDLLDPRNDIKNMEDLPKV